MRFVALSVPFASLLLLTAAPTAAAPFDARAASPHYVCERGPITRAALTNGPAPCCDGHFNCPQLLSNTGLVRPSRNTRT